MSSSFAHECVRAPRLPQRLVAGLVALSCLWPEPVRAQPAEEVAASSKFDELYLQADEHFQRGAYIPAAQAWTEAADHLPAGDADNRRSLYDSITDAYLRALQTSDDRTALEAAVTTLDRYAAAFTGAYPGVELNTAGKAAHEQLRVRLAQLPTPAPAPEPGPPPEPAPTSARPWKGLAIGGGVGIGIGVAMLGMQIGGFVVKRSAERDIGAAGPCPETECPELYERGSRAATIATVGAIAAPIFVVAGAAMLGIALKRRKSSTQVLSPVLSPTMAGLTWQHRF